MFYTNTSEFYGIPILFLEDIFDCMIISKTSLKKKSSVKGYQPSTEYYTDWVVLSVIYFCIYTVSYKPLYCLFLFNVKKKITVVVSFSKRDVVYFP